MLSCMALLVSSCFNEEEIQDLESTLIAPIDYIYNDSRVTVDFKQNSLGEISPVESENLNKILNFSERNPNLIFAPQSGNEIRLFANDDELGRYFSSKGKFRQVNAAYEQSSVPFLSDAIQDVQLYDSTHYFNPLLNLNDPCFRSASNSNDYWLQRRLQHFNDAVAFTCSGNEIPYNDRVSSVILESRPRPIFVRFFVDKNFGASSLLIMGKVNESVGYNDLSRECYGFLSLRHWDNKISSMRIYDVATGQVLNGIVSGGESTGGDVGGDVGGGIGDIGDDIGPNLPGFETHL